MSLTINSTLSPKDYSDLIYQMLKDFEGVRKYAYNDTNSNPTIGLGFEISAHAQQILEGMGYSPSSTKYDFSAFASALQAVGEECFPDSGPDGKSANLQAAINEVANKYLGTAYGEVDPKTGKTNPNFGYGNNTNNPDGSATIADSQIQTTFNYIKGGYETTLDGWLLSIRNEPQSDIKNPTAAQKTTALEQLPYSNERAALFSLAYNNLIGFKRDGKLKSPHLHHAIRTGDRAEAWYQIRYLSNRNHSTGIARHRYEESQIFGLYDDPSAPSLTSAVQTYQMVTAHRPPVSG